MRDIVLGLRLVPFELLDRTEDICELRTVLALLDRDPLRLLGDFLDFHSRGVELSSCRALQLLPLRQ